MDQKTSGTSNAANPQKPSPNSVSSLSMVPMTKDQAAKLVSRMLGSFPSLNLHDPKTYMANICTLLCGYPLWAGEDAVAAVKKKTKFIPTEAELYEELQDRTKAARYAADWERDAQRMIADHALLPAPPEKPKLSYEELRAKYAGPNGEPWGIANPDKPISRVQSARQAKDALIAKIGQEAFDAIPDARKGGGSLGDAAAEVVNDLEQPAA